ncbi:hypothetical protein HPB51_016949 [Rhipicephalus microplus]|uniref:P-type domain-containing protein n=1 Tax=Rhipicephalus microplus TaxID=6941 RepID=A0A9J6F5Z0_RHIMP|nr:hypothetical protein HPB51_016949 [Rhipicephalus microplus]
MKMLPEFRDTFFLFSFLWIGVERFDCHPEPGATRDACLNRGCCWSPSRDGVEHGRVPLCYFGRDHDGYQVVNTRTLNDRVSLRLKRRTPSGVDADVQEVDVDVIYYDRDTVRIRITDAGKKRFVPPVPRIPFRSFAGVRDYSVNVSPSGAISVNRSTAHGTWSIFHTDLSRLVFTNRFLQLSTLLPSDVLYGLGQHWGPLRRSLNWTSQILFNRDRPVTASQNLYGSHPFYLVVEQGGLSHGVFLHNSNFMEALLQPTPAVTFRALGGVFDFFVFVGPTPSKVVQQYQRVVGFPAMPPYWSLGFHLCRYGYESLNNTRAVMQNNILDGIPLDAQWNDIDSMERRNGFTYDTEAFAGLPEFVREVHAGGRRYILIFVNVYRDESSATSYSSLFLNVQMDIFVKNSAGDIKYGKVWNEDSSVFPDFSHPLAGKYWTKQFRSFHEAIPFDGAWIDMNEPANFENFHEGGTGCPSEEVTNPPPYVPGGEELSTKTLCMSDQHHLSKHYDLHNVYAHLEAILTYRALVDIRGKRPFIISRSTSPGQGAWSGQWSGDTSSSWHDLRRSVPSMLSFSLYGIPMTGSDICGFFEDATEEMCARWFELGAFYPFSRSHNMNGSRDQDPHSMGPTVVEVAKHALQLRYTLLPYLYTLFHRSHVYGETVARPLFFEFPEDPNTYDIDEQFLWGSSLLFNPVLYENRSSVRTYIPKGVWYDLNANGKVYSEANGGFHLLEAPLRTMQVLVRGGSIIPCQLPAATTEIR